MRHNNGGYKESIIFQIYLKRSLIMYRVFDDRNSSITLFESIERFVCAYWISYFTEDHSDIEHLYIEELPSSDTEVAYDSLLDYYVSERF